MGILETLAIAVGLSMDAFAVSIGKGLSVRRVSLKNALSAGLWFGGFQALMPLAGYFLGVSFAGFVASVDHWIAFVLLCGIGGNMMREALGSTDECEHVDASFAVRTMFVLAVATSIDALAAGVTFAFLDADIWISVLIIGVTTFLFSVVGILIGHVVGCRFHKGAEIFGGIVLVCMGCKILLEHLFFS